MSDILQVAKEVEKTEKEDEGKEEDKNEGKEEEKGEEERGEEIKDGGNGQKIEDEEIVRNRIRLTV